MRCGDNSRPSPKPEPPSHWTPTLTPTLLQGEFLALEREEIAESLQELNLALNLASSPPI